MSYEEIKTHLYTAINQVGDLEAERLRLEQAGAALIAENVKLREQVIALTPVPKVPTVAEWLASRGFFVDGDLEKLEMVNKDYVRVLPGALRCEVGPKDTRLAMIGRQPLSDTEQSHVFQSFVQSGWLKLSSKVVVWQAWHTSNQNPSLSAEIFEDKIRLIHSFNGVRKQLVENYAANTPVWGIRVGGWRPGLRMVEVYMNGLQVFRGNLELLPAGSTQGPVIKTGAYFPGWRDGQRLAPENVVVFRADWKVVQA